MTGLIILAAGESSRLGQPKQNLLFNGQTLLQRAADAGKIAGCKPVIVVLGANAGMITPIAETTTLYNQNWKEGIASSIRTAINEVGKDISINQVIIMLCDQPFVSAALLNTLINRQIETSKLIVACTYNNTTGVPALFDRALFTELQLLQGPEGAKKLLNAHPDYIATVSFEQGNIDIDTPGDYEQLRKLSD
jgi:molybdenum cofactor cytidylyltransferase